MSGKKRISAGDMDRRISLYREERIIGIGGRQTVSLVKLGDAWAVMATMHHQPVSKGAHIEYPVSVIFTLRHALEYLDARQIQFGTRKFDVLSVNDPHNRETFLEFRTREVVS